MSDSLLTRYRPIHFDEVLGQEAVVRQLDTAIKEKRGRAYLFAGPSGCGKTTLAYLAAQAVGCEPQNILDIDAASNTGIEDMREVASSLLYQPLGGGSKAVIVDECHGLSAAAWKSLLKVTEKPPPWAYWFFCTTNPAKVPNEVMTRCLRYELKPVSRAILRELLLMVVETEKMVCSDGVLDLCVNEASGSPRQALSNLAVVAGCTERAEAAELLRSAAESVQAFNLAQALVRGAKWQEVQDILGDLTDENPESVRHVVRAYVSKAVLGAKSEDAAGRGTMILDAFGTPFNSGDGIAPVIVACAKVLLS